MNGQISLEDEYQIALFAHQVRQMNEQDTKDALKRYYEIWVRREAMYKQMVAQSWGITQDDSLNEWG